MQFEYKFTCHSQGGYKTDGVTQKVTRQVIMQVNGTLVDRTSEDIDCNATEEQIKQFDSETIKSLIDKNI